MTLPARALLVALLACAARVDASVGYGSSETLVGWSDDGASYAVIYDDLGSPRQLRVYQGGKVVATIVETGDDVPGDDGQHASLDKVDVASWKPLTKFRLKPVGALARRRFSDGFTLDSKASLQPMEKQRCDASEWSLVRARDKQPVTKVRATGDHCLYALGGYVDESGKHALIKIREEWATIDDQEFTIHDVTSYHLVVLPE